MNFNILIQVLVAVIVIGVIYNLWQTTKAYGGLIGSALKWIGLGMLLFSFGALERSATLLGFTLKNGSLIQDLVLLCGLFFSAIGFSQLTKISKS